MMKYKAIKIYVHPNVTNEPENKGVVNVMSKTIPNRGELKQSRIANLSEYTLHSEVECLNGYTSKVYDTIISLLEEGKIICEFVEDTQNDLLNTIERLCELEDWYSLNQIKGLQIK